MSRETALLLNNVFLVISTVTVLIGTLYPLMLEIINNSKISVGPTYYNRTFGIILIPFILIMAIAPFLSWGRSSKKFLFKKLSILLCLTLVGTIIFYFLKPSSIFALICGSLSISILVLVCLIFNKLKIKIIKINLIKK